MSGASCIGDHRLAEILAGDAGSSVLADAIEHAANCDACRELLVYVGRVRARSLGSGAHEQPLTTRRDATGASDDRAEPLLAGTTLGRYRLGRELGRGGMGVVYEAHDPELDRRVAIKVLRGDNELLALARLAREARAVAALSHPNVVEVFDVSLEQEPPFIVMQLIEGPTLREWTAARPRRWRVVLAAYLQAARGLAAAHAVGLVHRDFKAANAIVDAHGRVRVLDFGLARSRADSATPPATDEPPFADRSTTLTATGIAVGTPSYMPPEQHRGDRIDARADIYAFAVALHEALYGGLPFVAATNEHLYLLKRRGLVGEPPEGSIPAPIHAAIRRALAPDPAERWTSIDELSSALEHGSRRPRSARRWIVAGVAAIGVASALIDFVAPPPDRDRSATPVTIDASLVVEAERLMQQARSMGERDAAPEGLGAAAAASTIAAASGSDSVRVRAELQLCASLVDAESYELAADCFRTGIEHALEVGEERAAAHGATRAIYALAQLGRPSEALEVGREARALAERVGDDGTLLVAILRNEAGAVTDLSQQIALEEQALALQRAKPELGTPMTLATTLANLGQSLRTVDAPRARDYLLEAFGIFEQTVGPDHQSTLHTALSLAGLESLMGEHEACAQRASSAHDRLQALHAQDRAFAATLAAMCFGGLGRSAEGVEWIERALAEFPEHARETADYASLLELQAAFLCDAGRCAEAEALQLRILTRYEELSDGPSAQVATAYHNLALIAEELGDLDRAETYARRAVEGHAATGTDSTGLLRARSELAGILLARGRPAEVVELLAEDVERPEDPRRPIDPRVVAKAKGRYARALWQVGPDRALALELARSALDVLQNSDDAVNDSEELRVWIESTR